MGRGIRVRIWVDCESGSWGDASMIAFLDLADQEVELAFGQLSDTQRADLGADMVQMTGVSHVQHYYKED
jgi:hypothetical protein